MPETATSTPKTPAMSRLDFLKRLTFEEKVAIETAADTDPEIRVVKELLTAADEIRLDDPDMVMGMALYVAKGLITEERKNEILAD